MYFMELANKLKARKKEYTCFIRRDKEIFAKRGRVFVQQNAEHI